MAKQHMAYLLFVFTRKRIEQRKESTLKAHLTNLLKLYALKSIKTGATDLFETGFFGRGSGKLLENSYKFILGVLRPQLLNLVEVTDIYPDYPVNSIGNKYGDIY